MKDVGIVVCFGGIDVYFVLVDFCDVEIDGK